MEMSELLNLALGGGLLASLVGIMTLKSTLKKAHAEAERAHAEADTVKLTNTEQATRILMENIVDPLKQDLDETRRDLNSTKREMARLRKAIDDANSCKYSADCPVLRRMRIQSKERGSTDRKPGAEVSHHGQRPPLRYGQRKRGNGKEADGGEGADVGDLTDDTDGQSGGFTLRR